MEISALNVKRLNAVIDSAWLGALAAAGAYLSHGNKLATGGLGVATGLAILQSLFKPSPSQQSPSIVAAPTEEGAVMSAILATVEADVKALIGASPVANEVEALVGRLVGSKSLGDLLVSAIPRAEDTAMLEFFAYLSAKSELAIQKLGADPLAAELAAEKTIIDKAVATGAGSECFKAIPSLVGEAETFFASSAAPTPAAAIGIATKAVAVRAVLANAPAEAFVITDAEKQQILAQRQKQQADAAGTVDMSTLGPADPLTTE